MTGAAVALGAPLLLVHIVTQDVIPAPEPNPYRGTEGPLEVLRSQSGGVMTGAALSHLKPGDSFAWVSTLCVPDTADVELHSELVRIDPSPHPIAWSDRTWLPGTLACLPEIGSFAVPRDAPTGAYELHRTVALSTPRLLTRLLPLPPIHVTVGSAP